MMSSLASSLSKLTTSTTHGQSNYDVIVLGYGAAGASAALEAARHGAKVLILEKCEKGGGNSFVSSANMTFPVDFQAAMRKDEAKQWVDYLTEATQQTTPREVIKAFVKGQSELPNWLESLGGELAETKYDKMYTYVIPRLTFPGLQSAKGLELNVLHLKQTERCPASTGGRRIWELLDSHIRQNPSITVRTSVKVSKITQEEGSETISGVQLDNGEYIAASAVVLCTGGFERNVPMRRDMISPRDIGLLGAPDNAGDGVKLAQRVGAQLWHMSAEATAFGFVPEGETDGFALGLRKPGFVYVNRDGERFVDEVLVESHRAHVETMMQDSYTGGARHDPMYLISDKKNMLDPEKPPIVDMFSYQIVVNGYKWSKHSEEEIKKGWITVTDSLKELADKLGLEKLEETVEKWNRTCKQERDEVFGRASDTLAPLEAPFCAVRMLPMLYNTQGGPRRNEKAQVIDFEGRAIEGLYGAGELGSIWGHVYQSSTNFAEALIFGRIAGREAAQLSRRWSGGKG